MTKLHLPSLPCYRVTLILCSNCLLFFFFPPPPSCEDGSKYTMNRFVDGALPCAQSSVKSKIFWRLWDSLQGKEIFTPSCPDSKLSLCKVAGTSQNRFFNRYNFYFNFLYIIWWIPTNGTFYVIFPGITDMPIFCHDKTGRSTERYGHSPWRIWLGEEAVWSWCPAAKFWHRLWCFCW